MMFFNSHSFRRRFISALCVISWAAGFAAGCRGPAADAGYLLSTYCVSSDGEMLMTSLGSSGSVRGEGGRNALHLKVRGSLCRRLSQTRLMKGAGCVCCIWVCVEPFVGEVS